MFNHRWDHSHYLISRRIIMLPNSNMLKWKVKCETWRALSLIEIKPFIDLQFKLIFTSWYLRQLYIRNHISDLEVFIGFIRILNVWKLFKRNDVICFNVSYLHLYHGKTFEIVGGEYWQSMDCCLLIYD